MDGIIAGCLAMFLVIMTPNECLQTFCAIKAHFNSSYDYFKYNGKLRRRIEYSKRKDKYHFEKIARHPDPKGLILSNVLHNPGLWAGEISAAVYTDWRKRVDALGYYFSQEIRSLALVAGDHETWYPGYGQHPLILRKYLANEISLETLSILIRLFINPHDGSDWLITIWDRDMSADPVWSEVRPLVVKYWPFLDVDVKKYRKAFVSNMMNEEIYGTETKPDI